MINCEGKCRRLHSHNGKAVITVESDRLGHRGMALDLGDIKRVVSS
ncbi:MAG: 6-carboxytetrahydropterin synthase [Planctomycetota bacterium]